MSVFLRIALVLACVFGLASIATAQPVYTVDRSEVTVCPAFETDTAPPASDAEGCQKFSIWEIDPQGKHIWAIMSLPIDKLPEALPLGLVVMAKASDIVYLNGKRIGQNGTPGDSPSTEIPGAMDTIYPLAPGELRAAENIIAIRMSSHAGVLKLRSPLHGVFVSEYMAPQAVMLRRYWPSIIPMGAFLLGALYFLVMAVTSRHRLTSGLLAAMSALAATQLITEISRGLVKYPYWFQDIRLLVLLICSFAFGMCLAFFVILRFQSRRWALLMGTVFLVTLVMTVFVPGFDGKTRLAQLVPTLLAAAVSCSAIRRTPAAALAFAVSLFAFAGMNLFGQEQFLDAWFYYAVAALLVFLFAQQAEAFARETNRRIEEEARSEKLEYVLDHLQASATEQTLSVKSAGRLKKIQVRDIAFIKGAGDYSELVLEAGESHLHSETMAELEDSLPTYFLRVHRSYLVNTRLIAGLERTSSGTGQLTLTNDETLPVSRRIMPKVREALQ